jgi:hypothetical protein
LVNTVLKRKRKRERDTDTDSLEDRIDSIEKSAKVERVKDCDKMKVAKGKVNLYLTCICFGIGKSTRESVPFEL